jgi:hypothetical protein
MNSKSRALKYKPGEIAIKIETTSFLFENISVFNIIMGVFNK